MNINKQITKILIFFFGLLIFKVSFPNSTQAAFVEVGNDASELAINGIGIGNYFDMNKLSSVFGDLLGPIDQELDDDSQELEFKLYFKNKITVNFENAKIHSLLIGSERGINNILLCTPRNIHVGSSLDEVWAAYGKKNAKDNYIFYDFPKCGGILFQLKNNRVIGIFINTNKS